MDIYMPLIAVGVGALTPVIFGLWLALRERDEEEQALVPLERRSLQIPTDQHRAKPRPHL
jgi:hypothetical protein